MTVGTWALWNVGLAGLVGAAGVVLAATAAHRVADPSLTTAALFLILHGGAAIALSALAGGSPVPAGFLASASLMLLAVALFSGDVAARVLIGDRLFPFAAPVGGSLLIVAWLVAAITGVVGALRGV
ncbi:DUF423 domain-containing protein [Hyphomicrobium sp.]|uniref:DUF423 domain-containing protein n=1 Tax=Hyphomicrobium sp. TaxID=82 RepID=UPI0025B81212|nr:DUF423 domain-containing protein [Hyphomicrobium sp.]MCC7252702.1 DUF423 domain-containing protein [Hyphomicrobium sp.]